ncbi:uncharacterized protein [Solanum lycopersicum]|uniref:uncharacterized protein n=1 Tax=Solanum lycopersicum TaxID=4081 RepID=UPI00374A1274
MAKTKRWQNLQNSVQTKPTLSVQPNAQPTTSQSISSVQAKKQMTSSVQATSQPVQSTQAASQSISSNQAVSHSTSSSQDESQPKSFKKRVVGRESTKYWTVEAIDSEGNKKKLKVKVKEVLNLSGEDRIVVNFDYLDFPFGEAQPLLSGFCGILAADSSLFPMHFDKWPNMPMSYFDGVFDQIIVEMCNRNAESRKKQIIPHTGGSKANSRRRAEMMAETGQMPGRAELYLATHKNVDGAYINEAAKVICQTMSQSTVDESIISPDDAVGKILGKEHSGRENYNKLLNSHIQMMAAFKSYMIMKEGALPKQFVGLFAPTTTMPGDVSDSNRSEPR